MIQFGKIFFLNEDINKFIFVKKRFDPMFFVRR